MVSTSTIKPATLWPPDDTEESILGVDRHQLDIFTLRQCINELAYQQAAGGPLPWQTICQVMVLGCVRPDGSPYTVLPDVAVFTHPLDRARSSFRLEQDGPPVLVVEVASPSTVVADLDVQAGKGWTYARAGVQEYLVLDPSGEMVPEWGRGWRLADGRYEPWLPDTSGHWNSALIAAALGVEKGLAAVYDRSGQRLLREGEVLEALDARDREVLEALEALDAREREGFLEGKRAAAQQIARARFGVQPPLEERIAAATAADLDYLLDRLPFAENAGDL